MAFGKAIFSEVSGMAQALFDYVQHLLYKLFYPKRQSHLLPIAIGIRTNGLSDFRSR